MLVVITGSVPQKEPTCSLNVQTEKPISVDHFLLGIAFSSFRWNRVWNQEATKTKVLSQSLCLHETITFSGMRQDSWHSATKPTTDWRLTLTSILTLHGGYPLILISKDVSHISKHVECLYPLLVGTMQTDSFTQQQLKYKAHSCCTSLFVCNI